MKLKSGQMYVVANLYRNLLEQRFLDPTNHIHENEYRPRPIIDQRAWMQHPGFLCAPIDPQEYPYPEDFLNRDTTKLMVIDVSHLEAQDLYYLRGGMNFLVAHPAVEVSISGRQKVYWPTDFRIRIGKNKYYSGLDFRENTAGPIYRTSAIIGVMLASTSFYLTEDKYNLPANIHPRYTPVYNLSEATLALDRLNVAFDV